MVVATLLRGFRVSVPTLDAFLTANGVDETDGWPPLPPGNDAISRLLHSKLGDPQQKARVFIPQRKGKNKSIVAYIAYAWIMVYAHREVDPDTDLPPHPPAAFEALCREVLEFGDNSTETRPSEGKFGMFLVQTEEGSFQPEELKARYQIPQKCDQCDETFETQDAWKRRQDHRKDVHGALEGYDPLPEA